MRLEELKRAYPGSEVQLWAEDEARLGLRKPVIRRVWAPVGKRPVAQFERGYKWTYLYGFVRPESGEEVYWLILPTRSMWSCSRWWRSRSSSPKKEVGAGEEKRVLFWWWIEPGGTPAGRSRSRKVYTPGVPALRLARATASRKVVAPNQRGRGQWGIFFEEIEEIEEALMERCVQLHDQRESIRNLTNYHWWPQAA